MIIPGHVIQIVGYKNSGKTHLMCRLVYELKARGYCVGTIKHDAHEFEIDHQGRDTWKYYNAGADAVAITSESKTAVIRRTTESLEGLITSMAEVDVVLVEGFKTENYPKIVMLRNEEDLQLLQLVNHVFAVASWFPFRHEKLVSVGINETVPIVYAVLMQIMTSSDRGCRVE